MLTLAELPRHIRERYARPVLIRRCGERGFRDWSTAEVADTVLHVAAGLEAQGVQAGDRVAIISESRPEWVFVDLAILSLGGVTVPVYPTLSPLQVAYILADSGARIAIVSDGVQAAKVREVRRQLPALECLAVIDSGQGGPAGQPTLADIASRGRQRLEEDPAAAAALATRAAAVEPDQLATIIYTSGTTGEPKGVMLTHRNIVSNVDAIAPVLAKGPEDVALSFLPLSHSFERTVVYSYLSDGVTIVFAESLETLARDLGATAPTIMTAVPRVFEKLHARIRQAVDESPAPRRWLFERALRLATARVERAQAEGGSMAPATPLERLADRLVFAKVRARVGGRLRILVSGSAPLPREIGVFFAAAGLPILEGYGLTETAPVLTANRPAAPRFGTVGPAIDGVELRIAPDGEILARGPNVMRGYWNKPAETADALVDGWFHTGDIGTLDADGYLTITDRKKDLLVTSGGKKVAPQPIEARLKQHPLVAEAILVGDRRRFPAALVAPDFGALAQALREPVATTAREDLVSRPAVLALYQAIIDDINNDLAQYEQIKRFALLPAEFSIAGGELTPTLKVRRRVIEDRWRAAIEQLYA